MFNSTELAAALGKKFPPTEEQAAVIEDGLVPKLVVAGAGAGKTETMASRVVYLVANGLVRPEQVLGLTFTRKAAQQLEQRIRKQLLTLRESGVLAPDSPAAAALETIAPKVATYDSYAGDLIREYGLLVPVEPSARIITDAEHFAIAREVVINYGGKLSASGTLANVTQKLLNLTQSMDNSLLEAKDVREQAESFLKELWSVDAACGPKGQFAKEVLGWLDVQQERIEYLPLVEALKAKQAERRVVTFNEQMAVAAKLARAQPQVGEQQRERYRVVMLDEYQDTSHSQRVLLRSLFGVDVHEGLSVTAVGDPMQAIYGWRGATAANLEAFVEDFPQAVEVPANKDQLTTSWRNPSQVLDLANTVASGVFGSGVRPVDELSAKPGAPNGDIKLGYYATEEEEHSFIADHLSTLWANHTEGEPFSAAVLVRTNRQTTAIAQALEEAGVPHEVIGLGGLLWEPEVQDIVAIATLLARPNDTAAALRVLSGPICGLGVADLQALAARQRNLAGLNDERVVYRGGDPLEHLQKQLAQLTAEGPDQVLGLGDALADLGERERYSAAGLERMESVAAKLRHLRTYSLAKPLVDLFADIESLFNIRTEVLARGRAGGATHLDKLAEFVAGFYGDSLPALLDYLELAKDKEKGLDAGEVPAVSDRVQIMTVHKAKGLEWEHVCVPHADSSSYGAKAETFLTRVEKVPGDEDYLDIDPEATKHSAVTNAGKAYKATVRERIAEESARLFYVALTRTEATLTVTGSGTNKKEKGPYEYLTALKEKFPELVVHWDVPESVDEVEQQPPAEARFPALRPRADVVEAAERVRRGIGKPPALTRGETYELWEHEAAALIEEHKALQAPVVEVEMPAELTASDMVAISTDPTQFARRQRRPVPFKPNTYAKRGTAFHSWLEERFGLPSLLTEDELPGMGEPDEAELAQLKQAFLESEWASRTPEKVEAPFEITIGTAVVRGRMDAVFREEDGTWFVVDWKTGIPPVGEALRHAEIQLAVYAEAWRRIHGVDRVRAAFHYVLQGYTLEPTRLPQGAELVRLLESSVSQQAR